MLHCLSTACVDLRFSPRLINLKLRSVLITILQQSEAQSQANLP
jgi:hypothetical protein